MIEQMEQAASLQSLQQVKVRLTGQLQQAQAERDRYKADSEQEHQQLLTAGQNQQNLQEQIRYSVCYFCHFWCVHLLFLLCGNEWCLDRASVPRAAYTAVEDGAF